MNGAQPAAVTLDGLLQAADSALRALFAPAQASRTPPHLPAGAPLNESDRRLVAGLMRVNHAGEIAAQALYHGQALMARSEATRQFLLQAAAEEGDHLAWCEQRLRELGDRTSLLNPLWYAGAFAIGATAAALSDRLSLGFVRETERQVEGHLAEHLAKLPAQDARTRSILETMQREETRHAQAAQAKGAEELPAALRTLMALTSTLMTRSAYYV
jgi:ubiquinone biosynthesis monooxygenase Coq7